MAKTFFTERDIEDLFARGVTSIVVHDDVVLTDLARERALKLGVRLARVKPGVHPADAPNEALVHRVKAAVLAAHWAGTGWTRTCSTPLYAASSGRCLGSTRRCR
jgi:hypothetical protein